MHALHFGAGYFGLGFACALLAQANVPVVLLNRRSNESTKDDLDTVSRSRRNELLMERGAYFVNHRDMVDPSLSDFQRVELEAVLLYDARNAHDFANTLSEYDDDLVVTFALRRIENYETALKIVAQIFQSRAERNCRSKIFLMACENGVQSSQVKAEFQRYVAPDAIDSSQVIFLQTSVDRICTRLTSLTIHRSEWLVVEAEEHAHWYIDDVGGIETLRRALSSLGHKVTFSKYVAQERMKKLAIVNGAHALVALHCWYLGIKNTDEFLNGTAFFDRSGTPAAFESVERRRDFLGALIHELLEGARLFISREPDARQFCERYMSDSECHRIASELVDRLSRTPDSVARIIKNFVRPEPADKIHERHIEFFRSVRARIEEPVLAYIQNRGFGPPTICQVLVEILDLLGRVDQFRNMPLFTTTSGLH